jgi:hypothetical protein
MQFLHDVPIYYNTGASHRPYDLCQAIPGKCCASRRLCISEGYRLAPAYAGSIVDCLVTIVTGVDCPLADII